jgi:ABC-2 type transport system permease protein
MRFSIIKFDFINNGLKRPVIMIYLFLFPTLIFAILSNITGGVFHIEGLSRDFYAVTTMIFIQFSLGTMITNMIRENSVKHSNLRLAYIVPDPFGIIFSKVLSLLVLDVLSIAFYIAVCRWIFRIRFHSMEWELGVAYLVCGCLSIVLGVILLLLLKDESLTNNIFGALQVVLCLAGGVFFPVCLFGSKFIALSSLSPAKWLIRELNKALYLGQVQGLNLLLLGFFTVSLVIFLITRLLFRVEQLMEQ